MKPYDYYNDADDPENNGVYVYLLNDEQTQWVYWSRIAPHGLANILRDGGWNINGRGRVRTARFVTDWGSGETVTMVAGQRADSHPSLDKPLVG